MAKVEVPVSLFGPACKDSFNAPITPAQGSPYRVLRLDESSSPVCLESLHYGLIEQPKYATVSTGRRFHCDRGGREYYYRYRVQHLSNPATRRPVGL